MNIHLVRADHADASNEQQLNQEELSGVTYMGSSSMVTDLVLVDGRYVAIEHVDDGDGPLLEED
jgi:hypothetical protein